jgi:hypothetical protein
MGVPRFRPRYEAGLGSLRMARERYLFHKDVKGGNPPDSPGGQAGEPGTGGQRSGENTIGEYG